MTSFVYQLSNLISIFSKYKVCTIISLLDFTYTACSCKIKSLWKGGTNNSFTCDPGLKCAESTRYVSVFCREPTFIFVLNYRLTIGTKKTGKKRTGKKARSSARSIGKQLYLSVSLVDKLAITSCLQSPSIVADTSAFSVRLDIYVCTTLLANNREEENRDDRPSHFLSFSFCFKLSTCCIRPVTR